MISGESARELNIRYFVMCSLRLIGTESLYKMIECWRIGCRLQLRTKRTFPQVKTTSPALRWLRLEDVSAQEWQAGQQAKMQHRSSRGCDSCNLFRVQ